MRHLRHIALAALAVATCAAPAAGAHDRAKGGGHLLPSSAKVGGLTAGDVMGEAWYRNLTLPIAENPLVGNGDQCARLGRTGKVLLAIGYESCTVPQGTTVYVIGITNCCTSVEEEPLFGLDAAAQRRCAITGLRPFTESLLLTVDGRKPIDLLKRRYEIYSPQRDVQLLPENLWDFPAGPATVTAWGWAAWLRDLPPGVHTLRSEAVFGWEQPRLGAGRQRRCGRPRRGRRLVHAGQVEVGYASDDQRRRGEESDPCSAALLLRARSSRADDDLACSRKGRAASVCRRAIGARPSPASVIKEQSRTWRTPPPFVQAIVRALPSARSRRSNPMRRRGESAQIPQFEHFGNSAPVQGALA
jgi:hypothetical protein